LKVDGFFPRDAFWYDGDNPNMQFPLVPAGQRGERPNSCDVPNPADALKSSSAPPGPLKGIPTQTAIDVRLLWAAAQSKYHCEITLGLLPITTYLAIFQTLHHGSVPAKTGALSK